MARAWRCSTNAVVPNQTLALFFQKDAPLTSPNFGMFTTAKALSRLSFPFSLLLESKRVGWIRFVAKPFIPVGKNTGHATGPRVNAQFNGQLAPPHFADILCARGFALFTTMAESL